MVADVVNTPTFILSGRIINLTKQQSDEKEVLGSIAAQEKNHIFYISDRLDHYIPLQDYLCVWILASIGRAYYIV